MYSCLKNPDHGDDDVCKCVYYDMQHKRLQTLHSQQPVPDALAAAVADGVGIPLGIDATGHGQHIRDRLALMYTHST
jgi:hypothetical protein